MKIIDINFYKEYLPNEEFTIKFNKRFDKYDLNQN